MATACRDLRQWLAMAEEMDGTCREKGCRFFGRLFDVKG